MIDIDKLAKNRYASVTLNILSGVALLLAAAWFSYNLFSARDLNFEIRQHLSSPAMTGK